MSMDSRYQVWYEATHIALRRVKGVENVEVGFTLVLKADVTVQHYTPELRRNLHVVQAELMEQFPGCEFKFGVTVDEEDEKADD